MGFKRLMGILFTSVLGLGLLISGVVWFMHGDKLEGLVLGYFAIACGVALKAQLKKSDKNES